MAVVKDKYTSAIQEPGLIVTINNTKRREFNRERRSMEPTRGPQPSWGDEFTDFVEEFGYIYDGAEGHPHNPRRVYWYFRPV
jgi:hypothetical protein